MNGLSFVVRSFASPSGFLEANATAGSLTGNGMSLASVLPAVLALSLATLDPSRHSSDPEDSAVIDSLGAANVNAAVGNWDMVGQSDAYGLK
jgi:hypothetical protein